jgi:hypothetical protein
MQLKNMWTFTIGPLLAMLVIVPASGAPYDPNVATTIDNYLATQSSPLSGYGAAFFQSGVSYNVDPRLIVAIAGDETSFGTNWGLCQPSSFNAWSILKWDPTLKRNVCVNFASWGDAIQADTRKLRFLYLNQRLDTIDAIASVYCASQCGDWVDRVTTFYQAMGGDVTDLSFNQEQPCVPRPQNLVSFWDADNVKPADTIVSDLAGGNTALIHGVTVSAGSDIIPVKWSVGNVFNFNGSSYLDMGPGVGQFGAGSFSLEAWFLWNCADYTLVPVPGTNISRYKDCIHGAGSYVNNIFRKSNYYTASPVGAGYWIRIYQDLQGACSASPCTTLEFFVGESVGVPNQPRANVQVPITPGGWHHVVGTYDGSTIVLYLDGQPVGTNSVSYNVNNNVAFTIGAWNEVGPMEFFSGYMDEISIYNRALGSAEVRVLYKAGAVGKCK